MNTARMYYVFFQQGCIKLIKMDSKYIFSVPKKYPFQINPALEKGITVSTNFFWVCLEHLMFASKLGAFSLHFGLCVGTKQTHSGLKMPWNWKKCWQRNVSALSCVKENHSF